MLISPNNSLLPSIQNTHRDISPVHENYFKNRNDQRAVFKRNYPFQRSSLHISLADTDSNIYNIANKVEPLKRNYVGWLIDIYA